MLATREVLDTVAIPSGDESVFLVNLDRRYRGPLIRYFGKRIREAYDVEDLVQEVFIRLVRQASIESVTQIDSYVFQTAANVIRDRARRLAARHHRDHDELLESKLPTNDLSPERVVLGVEVWGYDYLKVDGIGPVVNGVPVYLDNIRAISLAVQKSGRPMYVNLSADLDHDYAYWWARYSNGRRIDGDIECSRKDPHCSVGSTTGLSNITEWANVALRFTDVLPWQDDIGVRRGWNDFDSLEVGNETSTVYPSSSTEFLLMSNIVPAPPKTNLAGQPAFVDGLSNDERQSTVSLWSIGGSPLQLGDDLTLLDRFGVQLLTNDEILAVDQSGRSGNVVYEGVTPVFAQALCDGSYYVALFNTGSAVATVTVSWVDLGFTGNAIVRDLWQHQNLGEQPRAYSVYLNSHASSMLHVTPSSSDVSRSGIPVRYPHRDTNPPECRSNDSRGVALE